jgi:hypothetical protein
MYFFLCGYCGFQPGDSVIYNISWSHTDTIVTDNIGCTVSFWWRGQGRRSWWFHPWNTQASSNNLDNNVSGRCYRQKHRTTTIQSLDDTLRDLLPWDIEFVIDESETRVYSYNLYGTPFLSFQSWKRAKNLSFIVYFESIKRSIFRLLFILNRLGLTLEESTWLVYTFIIWWFYYIRITKGEDQWKNVTLETMMHSKPVKTNISVHHVPFRQMIHTRRYVQCHHDKCCQNTQNKIFIYLLLWINKSKAKDKIYMWVSVLWETTT